MNEHLRGLFEFHANQRDRIKKRFVAKERREPRIAVGVTDDTDGLKVTALSDELSAFIVERKS